MAFSADPTHLLKCPQPRPPPPSGRDETQNSIDYISQLPDAIILHIFSFLTTKEVIRTSVLSKRWGSIWTANPHISFSMPFFYNSMMLQSYMGFMDAVLLRCTAIKVKSFHFDAPFRCFQELIIDRWLHSIGHDDKEVSMISHNVNSHAMPPFVRLPYFASFQHPSIDPRINEWLYSAVGATIDRWLRYAVKHDVEEVSMILHAIYELPQFFFRCTTLVSFDVFRCSFSMIGTVNWSSLKRLRIEGVELTDDALMRVLSGSPVLEFFELKRCLGFKCIIVESRGLRELVIDSHEFRNNQASILKISAPHLLKLHLLGCSGKGEFSLDEVSSLVEAELNFNIETFKLSTVKAYGDHVKGLLERLRHVTRLMIGSSCLQVLSLTEARVFLPSLECRHLTFHVAEDHEGVPSIVKILESSPSLEKLFIQMTCTRSSATKFIAENVERHDFDAEEFGNSTNRRIYQCLMHLKNVEIIDPGADWPAWEPVLSLLKFLLQNLPWLDKIEINSDNSKLSKAYDMARIILSYPNRSPSLKVIHSYPSQGCSSKSVHNA